MESREREWGAFALSGEAEPEGFPLTLIEGGTGRPPLCFLIREAVDKLCRSFSPADRDTVYGVVLLRLLDGYGKRLKRIRDRDRLPSYVRTIVRREATTKRNRAARTILVNPQAFFGWRSAREEPDEPGLTPEIRKAWLLDIGLPFCADLQRTVLLLRLTGLSWRRIAAKTGRSRDAVKKAYAQAVKRIRRGVAERQLPPPPQ